MSRAPKKCGRFGCDVRVVGRTYCVEHSRRPVSASSVAARDRGERVRRRLAVESWVAMNGWVCPGYERAAHASRDLTAAHSVAVALGGVDSVLSVLCRSCNSRQGVKPL